MKQKQTNFEWYVLNENINSRKIEPFNIFQNYYVHEKTIELCKEFFEESNMSFEAFVERLDNIIRYEEWGRCEYEIVVGEWPFIINNEDSAHLLYIDKENMTPKEFGEQIERILPLEKIDCYTQAHYNIKLIAKYVLDKYKTEHTLVDDQNQF